MAKIVLNVAGSGVGAARTTGSSNDPITLYKPNDTVRVVQLRDNRKINPATGTPYKTPGSKGIRANEEDIKTIISHAKAGGIDPKTALAIALQETNIGQLDPNYGSAWSTFADEGIPEDRNKYANILTKAIKEKMAYAKELRGKGILPQGEEYDIQTYNGLGMLRPTASIGGRLQDTSYYGIPVTASSPLNLKKNPAYGKIVRQLRDEVIGTNPDILKLIESTPAYGQLPATNSSSNKVMLQVRK